MTTRYYHDGSEIDGSTVALGNDEAAHACRVMRAKPGQELVLFDGRGREVDATFASVQRREVLVEIQDWREAPRMPHLDLTMAIAMPKPERCKGLIERLTEMGCATLIPVVAERTQRRPTDSLLQKWNRIVIESCKQCGRNRLMEITQPVSSEALLSEPKPSVIHDQTRKQFAHVRPDAIDVAISHEGSSPVTIAIGPEGGWTDAEAERATRSDWQLISLGDRIYRIETAATVCAALAIHHAGDS